MVTILSRLKTRQDDKGLRRRTRNSKYDLGIVHKGAYVNFMMEEGDDRTLRATYGQNYNRLAKVKKRYDSTNLFRVNQNVGPK
jgi:hypothetical protein